MFLSFLQNHSLLDYDFSCPLHRDAEDRDYWQRYLTQAHIDQGEAGLDFTWPVIKATDFMEFKRSGNRVIMENIHFERRHQLNRLILAELAEYQGRFLPQIVNGLFAVCEETYWGISAHWLDQARNIPSPESPYIDLFAAETAETLIFAYKTLYKPLLAFCPEILSRVEYELERRIKLPYLTHRDFKWMGNFTHKCNNWNPWILSNVLTVFLATEPNTIRCRDALEKMFTEIQNYYDTLPADGGCDEGPGYWNQAGGALFDFVYQLKLASGGTLDLCEDKKFKDIGQYLKKVHIQGGLFANFSDCRPRKRTGALAIMFLYGRETKQEDLMNFSAAVYQENMDTAATVYAPSNSALRRTMYALEALPQIRAYPVRYPINDALELLPDLHIAALREGKFCLCAKGGHNAESHNHNDVGSFLVYRENQPILVDVGINAYTRFTFSDQRWEIPWVQSDYHNLPMINGVSQKNGNTFRADSFTAEEGRIRISFAGAYPAAAGVRSLQRELTLREGIITVEDSIGYADGAPRQVWEHFITTLPVELTPQGAVLGGAYLLSAGNSVIETQQRPFDDQELADAWHCPGITRIRITPEDPENIRIRLTAIADDR